MSSGNQGVAATKKVFAAALLFLLFVAGHAQEHAATSADPLKVARAAVTRGDWSAAREAYAAASRETPNDPIVLTEFGGVLRETGNCTGGIEIFQRALVLQPTNLEAQLGLGSVYQCVSNLQEARRVYERAVRQNPRSVDVLKALGGLEIGQNRYDDAILHLSKADILHRHDPAVELGLATAYNGKGNLSQALMQVNRVLLREPRNHLALFLRATVESAQGANPAALRDAKALFADQPNQPRNRLLLGKLLLRVNDCKKALDVLRPLDRGESEPSDAIFLLSRAAQCAGETAAAESYLDRFAAVEEVKKQSELNRTASQQLLVRAADKAAHADYEGALALTQQAIAKDPRNAQAYSLVARIELRVEKIEAAEHAAEQALLLSPDHPDYLRTKGLVLERQGRDQEALALFQKAALINPADAESFFHLGKMYASIRDYQSARAAYARAAALAPNVPEYQQAANEPSLKQ